MSDLVWTLSKCAIKDHSEAGSSNVHLNLSFDVVVSHCSILFLHYNYLRLSKCVIIIYEACLCKLTELINYSFLLWYVMNKNVRHKTFVFDLIGIKIVWLSVTPSVTKMINFGNAYELISHNYSYIPSLNLTFPR